LNSLCQPGGNINIAHAPASLSLQAHQHMIPSGSVVTQLNAQPLTDAAPSGRIHWTITVFSGVGKHIIKTVTQVVMGIVSIGIQEQVAVHGQHSTLHAPL
jgi:hypothetical protein